MVKRRIGEEKAFIQNIGVSPKGHLFAFNTTLKKALQANKWFNATEYFESVVGLETGTSLAIDGINYRVMRHDKKRNKIWVGPYPAP